MPLSDLPALRADFFACERLDDELLEFAVGLRRSYRTGILSDAPRSARAGTIRKFALEECFDTVVLSGEINALKPDPRAFTAILDALGAHAERTVFVDDRQANLDGAATMGMQTVRCTSAESTIAALRNLQGPSLPLSRGYADVA